MGFSWWMWVQMALLPLSHALVILAESLGSEHHHGTSAAWCFEGYQTSSWYLTSPRTSIPKETGKSFMASSNLTLKVTYNHFYHVRLRVSHKASQNSRRG